MSVNPDLCRRRVLNGGEIELRILQHQNGDKHIRVFLRSKTKRHILSYKDAGHRNPDMKKRVGLAAALLAQHQNEQYGDNHDIRNTVTTALGVYDYIREVA